MGRTYIATAEIFLVNPTSVNTAEGNLANASQVGMPLFAAKIDIPWEMKSDQVDFLGTNGSYTQVMGPEPIEMEMTINSWSMEFIDAILGRDENDRPYSKPVTFLIRGVMNEQGTAKREAVQVVTFGRFISGSIFTLEAGTAQTTDYTFSVEQISIKASGRSNTYNLVG